MVEEIIKNKNAEPGDLSENDNDEVERTRNEYKKQFMSLIEGKGIVFDLKLQNEALQIVNVTGVRWILCLVL